MGPLGFCWSIHFTVSLWTDVGDKWYYYPSDTTSAVILPSSMTRGDPLKHCNQELASETDAAAPDQPATMVRGPVEAWNGREFQSNLGKHFVNMEKDLKLISTVVPRFYMWSIETSQAFSSPDWTSFTKQYLGRLIPNLCMAVVNGF